MSADRWQACPVCKGRGDVPASFYGVDVGSPSTHDPRETCRTCGGATVLDTLGGMPPVTLTISVPPIIGTAGLFRAGDGEQAP